MNHFNFPNRTHRHSHLRSHWMYKYKYKYKYKLSKNNSLCCKLKVCNMFFAICILDTLDKCSIYIIGISYIHNDVIT